MKSVTGRMREELLIERIVTVEVADDATEDQMVEAIKRAALEEPPNFRKWDVLEDWDPEDSRWYFIDEIDGQDVAGAEEEEDEGVDEDI